MTGIVPGDRTVPPGSVTFDDGRPGWLWWLLVGCWWRPLCWAGRVVLWLVAWPLGLWRSIRHSQRHG